MVLPLIRRPIAISLSEKAPFANVSVSAMSQTQLGPPVMALRIWLILFKDSPAKLKIRYKLHRSGQQSRNDDPR